MTGTPPTDIGAAHGGMSIEEKTAIAERELREAVWLAIDERRIDGDLQCWVDTLQSLYAGEDVSVWECAKGGRGRVI